MPRKLKVFTWSDFRRDLKPAANGNIQSREILACHSMHEVSLIAKVSYSHLLNYGSQTFNENEIAQAMSEPGTVFYHAIDDFSDNPIWRKAQ